MPALQKAALKWGLATIMKNDEPIPYNWKSTTPKEHRLRGLITPTGVIMSADNKENLVPVIPPAKKAIDLTALPVWLRIVAIILAGAASVVVALSAGGVAIPQALLVIAKLVAELIGAAQ